MDKTVHIDTMIKTGLAGFRIWIVIHTNTNKQTNKDGSKNILFLNRESRISLNVSKQTWRCYMNSTSIWNCIEAGIEVTPDLVNPNIISWSTETMLKPYLIIPVS